MPDVAWDAYIPLCSLPYAMGLALSDLPSRERYVRPDPGRVDRFRARLSRALPRGPLKVGLVWAASVGRSYDYNRSLCLPQLSVLADVPGVSFVRLQVPPGPPGAPSPFPLLDWTEELSDFDETAALVANLDLVIAVDTGVAHLAGAMGVPTWTLVRSDADYRWLRDREDSPWYPGMRLFRQARPLAWDPVIRRVADELDEHGRRFRARPGGSR
jgi:hypothetical protein